MPKVGQPVQYFPCEGADEQAAIVTGVDDADCVCLVAWCPQRKTFVEHLNVPKCGGQHDKGDSSPFWVCLDEADDEQA